MIDDADPLEPLIEAARLCPIDGCERGASASAALAACRGAVLAAFEAWRGATAGLNPEDRRVVLAELSGWLAGVTRVGRFSALADAYLRLAICGGARPDDERLAGLRAMMLPGEIEQVAQGLAREMLRREPIPERAN
jgi:hypothetical protein